MRLQIGPYIVTIPAGSFHQAQGSNTGSWAYDGSISGVKLKVQMSALGGGNYQFKASGSPVDFSGASNPVTIAIGIGFDARVARRCSRASFERRASRSDRDCRSGFT